MKKKILSLVMTASMVAASLAGCGSTTSYADETIYGEVTALTDDGFTITVGTYDEESGELTLGDESADIVVTDDTTYSMNFGGGDMGEAPSGDMGEAPSGDAPSDIDTESDASTDETLEDADTEDETTEDSAEVEQNAAPDNNGEAPSGDKPDGDAPDGEAPSGDMGEAPSGDAPDGDAPSGDSSEAPDGEAPTDGEAPSSDSADGETPESMGEMTVSLDSIEVGTQVAVTFDSDGNVTEVLILSGSMDSAMGGMGGNMSSSSDITYSALYEYSEDATVEGESIASTGTDENAILITGGEVTVKDTTITKDSDDSTGGDNSSFYGVGATILTTGGTSYIDNVTIDSDADGGAGVFAYGDGVSYVANSTITTNSNTSGGIHAAGGGTLYAWDNTVVTNGESSAAIRSDRGGGTMVVDGGSYTSNGTGSPAVYCTADIAINDATLTATNSEAICIEGLNELHLFDCDLTGNIPENEQNDCDWNVILYQSMSGDSEVGNSTFEMVGGSLTAENGGMFYTTNTESTFILSNVNITYADNNDFFLKVTGNDNARGWGTSGDNGADCTFTAIDQAMEGDVIWDSISTLDFYMTDGSTLVGAVIDDESCAGNGGDGYCNLYISKDSTWTVTADSTLTALYNEGTIVDEDGNTVSIVGTDGTVYVEGTSDITVTVDSYSTSADMSGASSTTAWSDYEVEKPSQLS